MPLKNLALYPMKGTVIAFLSCSLFTPAEELS